MKILSAKQYGVSLKATIQNTGKLGFSGPTATVLKLRASRYVRFAQDDDPEGTLYLAVMPGEDEDGFRVLASGGYYSLSTRALFEALEVDFKSRTVIYDLKRANAMDEAMGGEAYRMTPRYLPKKAADGTDGQSTDDDI